MDDALLFVINSKLSKQVTENYIPVLIQGHLLVQFDVHMKKIFDIIYSMDISSLIQSNIGKHERLFRLKEFFLPETYLKTCFLFQRSIYILEYQIVLM